MRCRVIVAVLVLLAVAGGCGESTTVEVVNQEPTVTFTFQPIGVPAGFPVDLTVAVSDPNEGDNLTVTWEITRGSLTPVNADNTVMTWAVPLGVGEDEVTVTVSDGQATVSTTETIKVGTLTRGTPLPSYRLQDSPYILRADDETPPRLVIGPGQEPVIEAGVEILVDLEDTIIDVTGKLTIAGTVDNPVVIRANDRTLFCTQHRGWWEGILVGSEGQLPQIFNGEVNADYAVIRYAVNGIRLRDGGSATVSNTEVRCCGLNGILHEGAGGLTVTNSIVSASASNGITVQALTLLPEFVTITGCNITFNDNTGVVFDLDDRYEQVPVILEDSRIADNSVGGIQMSNWVWPTIEYNNISFNGEEGASNIRLQAPFHDAANPDTLDVSCNFWGAPYANAADIDLSIRDRLDSATLGTRLDVTPWLNSDPYQAPSPPPCDGGITQ